MLLLYERRNLVAGSGDGKGYFIQVFDKDRDVDDDIGDGRYRALDVDGAEITMTVDATRNYRELANAIRKGR